MTSLTAIHDNILFSIKVLYSCLVATVYIVLIHSITKPMKMNAEAIR